MHLKCCIKTCEYFILMIKENCQTENYIKFGKKLLLKNYVPFSLISWHLSRQIMLGGWEFVSYFRPVGRSFALKSCPQCWILTEKISGPWASPGGGEVTS